MKKLLVFATAALLISGTAFAEKGKKCTGKDCCKHKRESTATASKKGKETKKA